MIKINHKVLLPVLGIVYAGLICFAYAADEVTIKTLFNKNELVDLLAENAKEEAFTHEDWNVRNPFDTTAVDSSEVGAAFISGIYDLQGVFLGSDKPSAIINNGVVGIGDKIKGVTVKEIQHNRVVLLDGKGKEVVLELKK